MKFEQGHDYKVYYDEYRDGRPTTNYVWGRILDGDMDGGPVTVLQDMSGKPITIVHPIKFELSDIPVRTTRDNTEGRERGKDQWSSRTS